MNNKTKIYIFNPYPGIGGADTTISRFIKSINLNKYEVEYITLNKNKISFNKKIKKTRINSNSTFLSFFQLIKIVKKDKNKKKIFFSMQYFVNVWTIIFMKLILGIKTFTYEINHLNELKDQKNLSEFIKKNIILLLVKLLYKFSDIVAANSKESSIELSNYINNKVITIYNPCFEKIKLKKIKYKKNSKLKILNIARLTEQKDQLTILKAINISKIKSKIKFTIVGNGVLKNKLLYFIKKNKINCKIIDNETNLKKYYSNNDLFVFSSVYEGLPTTMVEAASYSLPIISSNFKTGSNEILCSGRGGSIFKIKNYLKLSELIYKFYINPLPFYKREFICRNNINKFSKKKSLKNFNTILEKF